MNGSIPKKLRKELTLLLFVLVGVTFLNSFYLWYSFDRLVASYHKAALAEKKVTPVEIALGPPRPDFARHAVSTMIARKDRPTGLVFGSSELTLGALQGLRSMNLEWPRDISIVGYHDPPWFELVGTGITTVRLPVQDIAQTATRVLLNGIKNEIAPSATRHEALRFSPTLVLRGSTATMSSSNDRSRKARIQLPTQLG